MITVVMMMTMMRFGRLCAIDIYVSHYVSAISIRLLSVLLVLVVHLPLNCN